MPTTKALNLSLSTLGMLCFALGLAWFIYVTQWPTSHNSIKAKNVGMNIQGSKGL